MDAYYDSNSNNNDDDVDRNTTTSLLNSYLIPNTQDFDHLYDNYTHTNISVNDISRDGAGQTDDTNILLKAYIHNMTYTSRKQAIANIIYSTINCGLVALPYSCSQSGIIIYIVFILLVSLISSYINIIIIAIAKEEKVRSLEEFAEITFGAKGYFMICLFQILYSILLMVMSLNVCTDIIISVADDNFQQITNSAISRRSAVIFLCSIIMLPMLLLTRSMSTLGFTSYISIVTIVSVFLSIFVSFIISQVTASSNTVGIDDDSVIVFTDTITPKSDWFIILFIVTFCFANNQKMFGVYSCLRRRNSSRWKYSVYRSHIIVALIYIVFGVFGYLSRVGTIAEDNAYDNKINYFLSYTPNLNKTFYDIIRSIIALGLLLTLPTDCLVAKTTLRRLIRRFLRYKHENTSTTENSTRRDNAPAMQIVTQRKPESSSIDQSDGPRDSSTGARSSGLRESISTNSVDLESEWRTFEGSTHLQNIIANDTMLNSPKKSKESVGLFLHDSDNGSSSSSSCITCLKRCLCNLCLDHTTYESSLAGLGFWVIVIVLALSITKWVLTILGFGIIATNILNFIFPSMLYFRIGLTDDFHAIPVMGLIPNRIYMLGIQVLGVLFLLLGVIFTFITTH